MKSVSLSIDCLSQKKINKTHTERTDFMLWTSKICFSRENLLYLLPENTCRGLNGIVRRFEYGAWLYIRSGIINWTTGKFFKKIL